MNWVILVCLFKDVFTHISRDYPVFKKGKIVEPRGHKISLEAIRKLFSSLSSEYCAEVNRKAFHIYCHLLFSRFLLVLLSLAMSLFIKIFC